MSAADDWSSTLANPEFQAQPLSVRNTVATNFFNSRVAPNVPKEHLDDARSSFMGEAFPAARAKPEPSMWQWASSDAVPGGGGKADILGAMAKAGGALNTRVQSDVDANAENFGRLHPDSPIMTAINAANGATTSALSKMFVPRNRLAVGLDLVSPAVEGIKAVSKFAPEVPGIFRRIANPVDEMAEAGAGFNPTNAPKPVPTTAAPVAEAAASAVKGSKPGGMAQLAQARAGRNISLGEAQYAIDHPEALSNAKSIDAANEAYADSVPGLKGKVQSLSERLNKTSISTSDYENAINRAGRLLNGTPIKADKALALTPQDALEGVQTINQAMRDKRFTMAMPEDQVRAFMKVKDGLMDYLQNNGAPNVRAAAKDLFEAHVKDAFSNWLPHNKFGSPDALRTMMSMKELGAAGALTAAGHPGGAALIAGNAMLTSPKVWGGLIKGYGAMSQAASSPIVQQGLLAGAAGASNIAGEEPATPTPAPIPKSPNLISMILKANTLNPDKSGQWGKELSGIGLPSSMISKSGKYGLDHVAQRLFDEHAINAPDEYEALNYLKSIAGKVK